MTQELLEPPTVHFFCFEDAAVKQLTSPSLHKDLDFELWCLPSLSLHGERKVLSIPYDVP